MGKELTTQQIKQLEDNANLMLSKGYSDKDIQAMFLQFLEKHGVEKKKDTTSNIKEVGKSSSGSSNAQYQSQEALPLPPIHNQPKTYIYPIISILVGSIILFIFRKKVYSLTIIIKSKIMANSKKFLYGLGVIIIILFILNPKLRAFSEFQHGLNNGDCSCNRALNLYIFSIYEDSYYHDRYLGIAGNFFKLEAKKTKQEEYIGEAVEEVVEDVNYH